MNETALRPILIVDDDEAILSSVELFLVDEGYLTVVAHNGREALELATSASPCLIILDMKMPEMDGRAFAAAYRKEVTAPVPIIVMTASRDSERRATEINADGFISKPFDLNHLLDLVHHHVGV